MDLAQHPQSSKDSNVWTGWIGASLEILFTDFLGTISGIEEKSGKLLRLFLGTSSAVERPSLKDLDRNSAESDPGAVRHRLRPPSPRSTGTMGSSVFASSNSQFKDGKDSSSGVRASNMLSNANVSLLDSTVGNRVESLRFLEAFSSAAVAGPDTEIWGSSIMYELHIVEMRKCNLGSGMWMVPNGRSGRQILWTDSENLPPQNPRKEFLTAAWFTYRMENTTKTAWHEFYRVHSETRMVQFDHSSIMKNSEQSRGTARCFSLELHR